MIRSPTDTTKEILTSSEGKRILNYISPIYSDGPIAVSVIQAIGKKLDDLEAWVQDFSIQANPKTATWGLDYWEQEYGIGTDRTLSYEQRRNALLAKMMLRSPMTPWRIETMLKNICGREVKVLENTGSYQFAVEIYPGEALLDYYNLMQILNNSKPAYLCYDLFITTPVNLKISIQTEVIPFEYFMSGGNDALCGIVPYVSNKAVLRNHNVKIQQKTEYYRKDYDITGTVPYISEEGYLRNEDIEIAPEGEHFKYDYAMSDMEVSGTFPGVSNEYKNAGETKVNAHAETENFKAEYELSGVIDTGIHPGTNIKTDLNSGGVETEIETQAFAIVYPICGDKNCSSNN